MLARLILLLSVALFGFLVFAAGSGNIPESLSFFTQIPYGDTFGHFFLIGFLAFIATWATQAKTFAIGRLQLPLGATVVFALIVLEEISQIFIPARSFSYLDLTADFLGTIVFGWLALRMYRRTHPQAPSRQP
jgi:VanZ family protein